MNIGIKNMKEAFYMVDFTIQECQKRFRNFYSIFIHGSDKKIKKYLKNEKIVKIVEIGSAPGFFVIEIAKIFSAQPYGIEKSENGYEMNKRIFFFYG